jgi:hypothetical protein
MGSVTSTLADVAREIDRHAGTRGWDQPPRLYALADTAELVRREPALAAQLGLSGSAPADAITSIEQEPLPTDRPLDEVLATIAWPDEVIGAAIVVESLVLPPSAEADLPDPALPDPALPDPALPDPALPDPDGVDVAAWVARHPDRQDVRITVAVLRGGRRECVVRLRAHDTDESVLAGTDLAPALGNALATTLD